jgi:hypothetical protein
MRKVVLATLIVLLISANMFFADALATLNGVTHQYSQLNSKQEPPYIAVTTNPTYGGTVTVSLEPIKYTTGATGNCTDAYIVKLQAKPTDDYQLGYWVIDGVNASSSKEYEFITAKDEVSVQAVFCSQLLFNLSKTLYEQLSDFANTLNASVNSVNDSVVPSFDFMASQLVGAQLGVYSIQDLADYASTLAAKSGNDSLKAQSILYAYTLLMPYGILNETAIKWALDNMPMLSNGLPDTGTFEEKPVFCLQQRYVMNGYYWANLYMYNIEKWNLIKAYQNFHTAIENAAVPATLYVTANGTTYCHWGNAKPRYYDECAQTMEAYLRFYELGVNAALPEAVNIWTYINANCWQGDHYGYYVGNDSFECESGGFDQIALKLIHYVPDLPYTDRIALDLKTRLIQSGFDSIQWTPGEGALIVHDYAIAGSSARLENTLITWASIYGSYEVLDAESQQKIRNMLNGCENVYNLTAWQYTLTTDGQYGYSQLYDPHLNLFEMHQTTSTSLSASATAIGESILIMLGITPETTSLAVPIVENIYQDIGSGLNPSLIQLNLNTSTLKIPVSGEGTLSFYYGQEEVSYAFPASGVYVIQFSSDYNTILEVSKLSDLPSAYLYYHQIIKPATTQEPSNSPSAKPTLDAQQTSKPTVSTTSVQPYESTTQRTVKYTDNLQLWNVTLLEDAVILAGGTVLCMGVILRKGLHANQKTTINQMPKCKRN